MKSRATGFWIPALLVVACFVVYANALDGPFIFDDVHAIVDNPHLRQAWPPVALWQAPAQSTIAGRPLVSLSLALNHALGGYSVRGYHLTNVALHACVACLLFGVTRRTAASAPLPASIRERATAVAAATAALWALHPLNSEAVNYVVQRTELMMALCYLLALYAAIRAVDPGRRIGWSALAVAACLLGVACKESIVTAPVALILHDWVFLSRDEWRRARRGRLALYAGMLSSWLAVGWVMVVGPRSESVGFGLGISSFDYARSQATILVDYVRKAFWPSGLLIDYGHARPLPPGEGIVTGLSILLLTAVVCIALHRRRLWSFAAIWPLLLLAPTSSFVPIVTEVGAERRMYLPLMGLVALLVGSVVHLAFRGKGSSVARRGIVSFMCLLLIVVAAMATRTRNLDYRDEERLWRSGLAVRPEIPRMLSNLGRRLQLGGRLEAAIENYRKALAIDGKYSEAQFNLGTALAEGGDREGAMEAYRRTLQLNPRRAEAHHNLGSELANDGRLAEAVPYFRRVVELTPTSIEARRTLSRALLLSGDAAGARDELERALETDGDEVGLLSDLSWLLATSQSPVADPLRAERLARRAVELSDRRDAMALDSLSVALDAAGSSVEALAVGVEASRAARESGQEQLADEVERRLALWRAAGER